VTTIYSAAFAGLFLCFLYFEHSGRYLIPRWVLNVLSLAVLGLCLTKLTLSDPVIPILDALVVLLGIKFIEQKRFRDYMQICAIAIFLLSGSALVTLGMTFLLYFCLLLVLLSLTIVFLAYLSQDDTLRLPGRTVTRIAAKSLLIPAAAIPLAALIFVILPRTDYPLLNFLNVGQGAATGFSETVRLGAVSEIQEDASVIFRAQMPRVAEGSLYWRGIVFDHFDGAGWSSGKQDLRPGDDSGVSGLVDQTIYLEPYGNRNLFALDMPVSLAGLRAVSARKDHSFSLDRAVHRRVKYQARSAPKDIITEKLADPGRYLQLPEGLSSDIAGLARARTVPGDDQATVRSLTLFLREGGFSYSLRNLPETESPLEEFLFRRKEGNCEYFASALAVLLRSAGIPSRLVGGYRGGYYNEMGEYYLVRQSDAHVWVEAHIGGTGWVRLDPTPPATGIADPLGGRSFTARVRLMMDAVNYYWNAVVLPYDLERQMSLYRQVRAGIARPDLPVLKSLGGLVAPLGLICLAVAVASMAWVFLKRREPVEKRVVRQFLKALDRSGYHRGPSEGLDEFASRIRDQKLKDRALLFVKEFQNIYYRDRDLSRQDVLRLREIVRGL
jgi:hypothetical protein